MSHDRSDLTEDKLYPWKTRQDRLQKFGPKDVPIYLMGGREDHTEVDFIEDEKTMVVSDGVTSPPVYRADWVREIGVVLDPSGTAKMQYTLSPIADVTGGTARWVDWSPGEVTATTSEFLTDPITAIRIVSVSGEVTADIKTES